MQPKKSLGQNFLKDKVILRKIIQVASLNKNDLIIEVGSGKGALTTEIIKQTKNLILIEKDAELAEKLARHFKIPLLNFQSISSNQDYGFKNNLGIISGDVLKINLVKLLEENHFQNYKVVANIPYYITSPLIRLFLETLYPPKEMILMLQKEVAERISARAGKMSLLAVSVRYYAQTNLLFYVGKESFYPQPKVDSAVIRLTTKRKFSHRKESLTFFRIVRAGFSAKRKTLLNNLSNSLHLPKTEVEKKLRKINLKPTQRPQELSVNDWKKLAEIW
ncbi:MAG TPA: ribosomal RNA small subunit methyltransferase A [Candidatus Moranbacteria bacterium]|nr:ribosomal RNA small subunit methyltransferase A [Candidatus Moranbacteria bacterium]